MKITIDTNCERSELDALLQMLKIARPDWALTRPQFDVVDIPVTGKPEVHVSNRIAPENRPEAGVETREQQLLKQSIAESLSSSLGDDPFKAIREANELAAINAALAPHGMEAATTDTHGSPELDADAAKLTALGQDAGITVGEVFSTPLPPPPAPASGVAVDKTGLPWDSRIHSETKATLKDGTWRQRRGVSADLVKTIETQLRAAMAAPVTPAPAAPVTTQTAPPPLPSTPAAPPLPPAPLAPSPGGPSTAFTELILFITKHKKDGKLNDTQVKLSLEALQMPPSIPLLANRPDLIPALMAKLRTVAGV